jgi:Putative porin
MKTRTGYLSLAAGVLAAAVGATAHAQSEDPLIQKLVQKGILTTQEAADLEREAAKEKTTASPSKTLGLPDWVTGFKLYGDFRGRFEQHGAANKEYYDRNRFRYRLRTGLAMSFADQFEVGFRLASGDPVEAGGHLVGGQPITANTTMGSLESRKFLWVDEAYAKWTPIKTEDWVVSGTIGKMQNPFQLDNMVWDYDITPEGAALQTAYHLTDKQTLKANSAFFVLDEINQGVGSLPTIGPGQDPYVYGAQAVLESKWTPKVETSAGLAVFDIGHRDSLSASLQPFSNSGNTRDAGTGSLKYNFNPIIGTASATYTLDSFPLYSGKFPIRVLGDYMENPAAPSHNQAYRVGVMFGKAGRKHTWEIGYRYQRLEADSWFDALVDDDNSAFYAVGNPQLTGTGKADGTFGGTNVKGHLIQLTYSFTDYLDFTFYCYLNKLIINAPGQSSNSHHFYADFNWRF